MLSIDSEIAQLELRIAQLRAVEAQAALDAAVPKQIGAGLDKRWAGRESFSISEVAEILGVSPVTMYRAAANSQIPTIRVGRVLRVGRTALEKFIGA